jgi:hypothetical protein
MCLVPGANCSGRLSSTHVISCAWFMVGLVNIGSVVSLGQPPAVCSSRCLSVIDCSAAVYGLVP